jgi:hypothetical protein
MNRWTSGILGLTTLASAGCAYLRAPAEAGPPAETFRWKRVLTREIVTEQAPDTSNAAPETRAPRRLATKPPTGDAAPESPPPTTPAEAEVDLSVELAPAERARLAEEARTQIDEAQRVVDTTPESTLPAIGKDTLATIRELIGSANDALNAGDVRAAESLARKAYLLAEELRAP